MKTNICHFALFAAIATSTTLHAGNFVINPDQSELKAEMHASPSHDFTSVAKHFQTDIEIDPQSLEVKAATCHFDFAELDSGKGARDKKMCKWMDIEDFPGADFTLQNIQATETPQQYIASGELKMHGQTIPVTIDLKVHKENENIVLDGSSQIDYQSWDLPKIRLLFFTVDPVLKPSFHLVGTIAPNSAQ